MPFYRMGEPGSDFAAHVNFGRRAPARGVSPRLEGDNPKIGERCGRPAVALCDGPAGHDLGGKPLTCDAPMCEKHRTSVGPNLDRCPRCVNKESRPAMLTLAQRAAAYNERYPHRPASHLRLVVEGVGDEAHDVIYGQWMAGQDYRNRSTYYGAYPGDYLERIWALFPDIESTPETVLHAFSGSLPAGPYRRCDMRQPAEYSCAVEELPVWRRMFEPGEPPFRLILADPPYSKADAAKYGTPAANQPKVTAALAEIAAPGAFLVWLDTTWPRHRKREWRTVGRIPYRRSAGHRLRDISIFERTAA